jgi:hypothetical protein
LFLTHHFSKSAHEPYLPFLADLCVKQQGQLIPLANSPFGKMIGRFVPKGWPLDFQHGYLRSLFNTKRSS